MASPRIALAIDLASSFGREVIQGVLPLAHQYGWTPLLADPRSDRLGRELRQLGPDGVILMLLHPAQARICLRLDVPVVNVGLLLPRISTPHVGNDDQAIGAMAAGHLLDRGCRRMIAIGSPGRRMDDLRLAGFSQAVQAAGSGCEVLEASDLNRRLPALVRGRGDATGVFAVQDRLGAQAITVLTRAGIAVPARAAVVGVDNDDIACRLSSPELSSVAVARREIGAAAAGMLASLLDGSPTGTSRFIAPLGVVVRASSDHFAVADPDLAAACACIRERAHQRIGPEEVVAAVPLSRSSLQRRFREAFGQTLREAIRAARLDRARRLLADSDLKLAAVARASGFANSAQLVHLFRQAEGITPEAWRRRLRQG